MKKDIGINTSSRLSKMYIIALSALALIIIIGQILIQRSIRNQLSDSNVINKAGSQRYISQQIVKFSLLIDNQIEHKQFADKNNRLEFYLKKWQKGHQGLQYGDTDLELPGQNSETITQMFQELDPYYQKIASSASAILAESKKTQASPTLINKNVRIILDNEDEFFIRMDAIVKQYAIEAREKVGFLSRVEYILFSFSLLIMLFEGFFIFRPAVLKIRETIEGLVRSEERANTLSARLKMLNLNLQQSMKDHKDVSFAMDRATILVKTDRYGVITYVNEKFSQILKYDAEELIGKRFGIISSHYHSKAFYDDLWETISAGKIWNKEIQNMAKDGSYVWLDVTIVPVLDNSGTPERYIAIYTDVTSRFRESINEQKIRSASILEGQEKERKNIARELHDGLGQMLTALKFNFDGMLGSKSKKEQDKILELRKQITDTIQETRRISFNLMPNVLNDYGLVPAVKHLTEQMSGHSNINIIFESRWENQRLGKALEINLYRIIQEALNNAVKYAEADEVRIEIDKISPNLRLQISDNGKGFSPEKTDKKKITRSGNGIINIQERTDIINGDFRIQTAPGEGTKILIKVPLPETIILNG